MKQPILFAASSAIAASMLSGCAAWDAQTQPAPEKPANVPAALQPSATRVLTLAAQAKGVQIYTCGPDKNNAANYAWNFKAPEADLFNADGKPIGKHYAGPTWEGNDGSKVVGQVAASDRGPDPKAIAWLLLSAKSNSGAGIFGKTASVQRLATAGGKAPDGGCDAAHAGSEARVAYTARYYFYD
ncbi:MAG TPA: DUF3455 domain-containing protein [Burkholderiaceae bacterium]